jgi:hypothetical protein
MAGRGGGLKRDSWEVCVPYLTCWSMLLLETVTRDGVERRRERRRRGVQS